MLFKTLVASIAALASVATADDFPTIEVLGNKFFYSNNGSQFYIKGVAYQQDTSRQENPSVKYVDPLIDTEACKRDIPYLQELYTNVVRVYALDPNGDHDECMSALQDAGIYVIADLSAPNISIATESPSWNLELYDRYTSVIDMMQQYDNTLGFFAGNEVITNSSNSDAAPFVKAAIRDMKAYISDKGYRSIPVGYSANDDGNTRIASADYFCCGDDEDRADFYGINMYEWCGESTFQKSGYSDRTEEFSNLTIPVFFSEYGCNTITPRKFTDVAALYSDEMTDVWSGGIIYMYFEEANEYGLVSVDDNDVSTLSDFNNLKSELASVTPTTASTGDVTASGAGFECPATYKNWKAATALPPSPDQSVCDCIESSNKCVVDDSVDESDYGDLFSSICGLIDCSDINGDGSNGTYGAFAYCSPKEKLSYLLNKYYEDQDEESSACDFDGSATIASASADSTCSSLIASASSAGGSVSGSSSGSKTSGSSGSSGSGSGSSGSGSGSSSSGSGSASGSGSSSSAGGAGAVYAPGKTEITLMSLFSTLLFGAFALAI